MWSVSSCRSVGFRNSLPAPRRQGLGTFCMKRVRTGWERPLLRCWKIYWLCVLAQYIFLSLVPMTSIFQGNACSFVEVFPLKSKEISFSGFLFLSLTFCEKWFALWKVFWCPGKDLCFKYEICQTGGQIGHASSICLTWAGPRQFSHSWCIRCHWVPEGLALLLLCGHGADLSWSLSIKNVWDLKLIAQCADCSLPPPNLIVKGSAFIICCQLLYTPVFSFE